MLTDAGSERGWSMPERGGVQNQRVNERCEWGERPIRWPTRTRVGGVFVVNRAARARVVEWVIAIAMGLCTDPSSA